MYYQNLESIWSMVWKLCAVRHWKNVGNFWQFLYHNFRLKGEFQIIMVSSERFSSDLSILRRTLLFRNSQSYFKSKKYFFIHRNQFLGEKCLPLFAFSFRNTSKVQRFSKFQWLHRKKHYQNIFSFFFIKKRYEVKKKF